FSPYSRFGLGELNQNTLAHNQGMGGAFAALKPDSIFPVMINTGNPASYSLIKFATFEVGGFYTNSKLSSQSVAVNKHNANFSYAVLGFPIRKKSGATLGIMPYSSVGYNLKNVVAENNIGDVTYNYNGEGGFNKVFVGFGTMPFKESVIKLRKKEIAKAANTDKPYSRKGYALKEFASELLSDFSIGANANYLFGSVKNYADVRYPNSNLYYNTIRESTIRMHDFTGNFGIQTGFTIDSVKAKKSHDTLQLNNNKRIALREKVKIVFGYYMNLNNNLSANYDLISYNYFLTNNAGIMPRDTVIKQIDAAGKIKLPLEQGFGIGIKKGEKLNIVMDYAITNWSGFKLLNYNDSLKNSTRMAIGFNYVPEKFATGKGTFFRRSQYRMGAFYNTGYLNLNKTLITTYGLTAG
ncbi:MAG: hypothetical protein JNM96_02650, partial [Bacteroidia bacterium]|nr:hypothetical protein [Bacteroidia bacterium]